MPMSKSKKILLTLAKGGATQSDIAAALHVTKRDIFAGAKKLDRRHMGASMWPRDKRGSSIHAEGSQVHRKQSKEYSLGDCPRNHFEECPISEECTRIAASPNANIPMALTIRTIERTTRSTPHQLHGGMFDSTLPI